MGMTENFLMVVLLLGVLFCWVYFSWTLYEIARRLGEPWAPLAWAPFLKLYVMWRLAHQSLGELSFFMWIFTPITGGGSWYLLDAVGWGHVAKRCGRSGYLGLWLLLPVLGWWVPMALLAATPEGGTRPSTAPGPRATGIKPTSRSPVTPRRPGSMKPPGTR